MVIMFSLKFKKAFIISRGKECLIIVQTDCFFEFQGKHYHHIIDPRTGYPARGTLSVTVLSSDAALADAASTALFIAGPELWPEIARKMAVQYVMLISDDNKIYLSPAMAERIELFTDRQPVIIP